MKRAAGAIALLVLALMMLAPSLAHAVSVTWPITVSAPSAVALDSTTFTGSQLTPDPFFDGTTLVGNLTGCSPCSFTGGADDAKFKIVTTGWHVGNVGDPGYRGPVELQTRGNVLPQTNGWNIQINSTPIHIGPPAYNSRSTVTHVSPGTSVVQGAINSASAGTTLVLNAGSYTECGGWTMKANVDVVHLADGNHATINGCSGAMITGANNAEVYGLNLNNFGQTGPGKGAYLSPGLNSDSFINNNLNMSANGGVGICQNGGNGLHVAWNTFSNFSGNDVECGGGDQNFLNEHNALHNAPHDMEGGTSTGVVNRQYIDNFADRPGQNCGQCGTGSYIETAGSSNGSFNVYGNWVSYAGGVPVGFAWSMIGEGTLHFRRNYWVGDARNTAVEFDAPHGQSQDFLDNYGDGRLNLGGCCGGFSPGVGFGGAYTGSQQPNVTISGNNELPSTTDYCDGVGSMPCNSLTYTRGTNIDFGVPAAPAAGSSQ